MGGKKGRLALRAEARKPALTRGRSVQFPKRVDKYTLPHSLEESVSRSKRLAEQEGAAGQTNAT